MVADLIRDSFFGHAVRLATGQKAFTYPEERDPAIAGRYYHYEKSTNMARYGQISPPEDTPKKDIEKSDSTSPTPRPSNAQLYGREDRGSVSSSATEAIPQVSNIAGTPVDSEKGRDVTVIDWDGPNDPENPRNWSTPKKFFVTFEICLLTTGVYIGSAIYTPGLYGVMEQFRVSQLVALLGLCLFVAGYGLGPMVFAPMSEIPQIGRMPIYIITLIVFVVFQLGVIYARNIGMLLAFRFLTGLFGSPVLATGGATLADIYPPKKQAYALSVWGMSAVAGPTLGPTVASFAVVAKGWTWSIWPLMWLSGFALLVLIFFLPETSSANILYRKTRRIAKITGNDKLTCAPMLMGESMTGKDIVMMVLVRPITLNFQEPMVFLLNLYIALIYGLLYIWFESFPITFLQVYRFPEGTFGLTYLGILGGALVTIGPFFAYLRFVQEKQFDENGNIQPEKRLIPAMFGSFAIPICLFWFGWSAGRTHWIVPIIGSGWFSLGAFCLFNSILSYLGDAYPDYVASVYAGNDLFRSAFGAGFPLFATAMYNKLGIDWASSTLGFISIAFIPIPFVLYKYGRTLRVNHSKFARKDI
ncbi:major facilitator superfamily domain-containing protein [Elsinoe ampelina]|uniref:Cercosporin MFS transporter CTB4 n=1 Tax=Elsinoe ampelina TaxID=302913 RepID=A0A6A6GI62_9PEZI|nr:major facilitator superfamily domain-containing protein [Elsinoe ampelina]